MPPHSPGAKGQRQWEPWKATVPNMALLILGALGNDLDATSSLGSTLVLTGMGQVQDMATPLCPDQRPTGCAERGRRLGEGRASLPSMKPLEVLCPSRTLVPMDQLALIPHGNGPEARSSLSMLDAGEVPPGHPHSFPAPTSARIPEKASAGAQPTTTQAHRCHQSTHADGEHS